MNADYADFGLKCIKNLRKSAFKKSFSDKRLRLLPDFAGKKIVVVIVIVFVIDFFDYEYDYDNDYEYRQKIVDVGA